MLGESGGMTGEAGSGNECEPLPVHSSSFCVLGTPLDGDAVELTAGMPLTVSGEPEGCYSSSCDKVELDYCAVIGSDRFYSVSLAYCRTSVGTPGGACTGDCARQSLECAPGVTLEEGEYTINSAGSGLTVTFTVPSQVHQAQLCAPAVQ
ncbi:MAG TPA: hypothetical protein VGK73_38485, partial [Polyangiaceae bacterium]